MSRVRVPLLTPWPHRGRRWSGFPWWGFVIVLGGRAPKPPRCELLTWAGAGHVRDRPARVPQDRSGVPGRLVAAGLGPRGCGARWICYGLRGRFAVVSEGWGFAIGAS